MSTPSSPSTAPLAGAEATERLRHSVARLARLLRQQDEGGLGATSISALASVRHRGPITLGELAAVEQVAPPTMTKVVEKLESHGFVVRTVDPNDRRVNRVAITAAGRRHIDATRARRTAWLAARVETLEPSQRASLGEVITVLEALIAEPGAR
jgi:DNA-binding MarR family transcriptional regulator